MNTKDTMLKIKERLKQLGINVQSSYKEQIIHLRIEGTIEIVGEFNYGQIFAVKSIEFVNLGNLDIDNRKYLMGFTENILDKIYDVVEEIQFQ